MAIGNAPWPLGVTMVGIHARTGREKIFAQNVARILLFLCLVQTFLSFQFTLHACLFVYSLPACWHVSNLLVPLSNLSRYHGILVWG